MSRSLRQSFGESNLLWRAFDRDRFRPLADCLLQAANESGLKGRRLADQVAGELKIPRRQVYQTYLALKEQGRVE